MAASGSQLQASEKEVRLDAHEGRLLKHLAAFPEGFDIENAMMIQAQGPGNRLLVAGLVATYLFRIENQESANPSLVQQPMFFGAIPAALMLLPDARIVLSYFNDVLEIRDKDLRNPEASCVAPDRKAHCLAVRKTNPLQIVSGNADGDIYVWDEKLKEVASCKAAHPDMNALAVLPDGSVLTGSGHNNPRGHYVDPNEPSFGIKIWNPDYKEQKPVDLSKLPVLSLVVTSEGKIIFAGDGIINVASLQYRNGVPSLMRDLGISLRQNSRTLNYNRSTLRLTQDERYVMYGDPFITVLYELNLGKNCPLQEVAYLRESNNMMTVTPNRDIYYLNSRGLSHLRFTELWKEYDWSERASKKITKPGFYNRHNFFDCPRDIVPECINDYALMKQHVPSIKIKR